MHISFISPTIGHSYAGTPILQNDMQRFSFSSSPVLDFGQGLIRELNWWIVKGFRIFFFNGWRSKVWKPTKREIPFGKHKHRWLINPDTSTPCRGLFLVINDTILDKLYFCLLLERPFVSASVVFPKNSRHLTKLCFDAKLNSISFHRKTIRLIFEYS